jgi:hypothetical protein|tara:strand:+ start:560 stop:670 length:111 start_codon:yes stop_codon:yes gene_type:complete
MLFSLACLAGFMTLVCAPGLIAQARANRANSADEAA